MLIEHVYTISNPCLLWILYSPELYIRHGQGGWMTAVLASNWPGSEADQQLELPILADVPGGGVDGVDVVTEWLTGHPQGLRGLLKVSHLVRWLHVGNGLLCRGRGGDTPHTQLAALYSYLTQLSTNVRFVLKWTILFSDTSVMQLLPFLHTSFLKTEADMHQWQNCQITLTQM